MKPYLLALIAACCAGAVAIARADDTLGGITVSKFSAEREGRYLDIDMSVDLAPLRVASNQAVLLTPVLANGVDSMRLPSIGIYGKHRYIYYQRNSGGDMLSGSDEITYKASDKPDAVAYSHQVEYADWMDGASLTLRRAEYGCCRTLTAEGEQSVGKFADRFFPTLVYARPTAETAKHRSLEGSAFIDFPVNRTEIDPDYRGNSTELAKIQATIDSVRSDADITITGVWLKGYASPEGAYAHNADLARERTEALKHYIEQLYRFDPGLVTTASEPEDWEGLRHMVAGSNLDDKETILAVIDSDLEPDAKDARLRTAYPEQYRFMLSAFYPALRHTDYRIAYDIVSYSNPDTIIEVMQKAPQKLSLNEFYIAADRFEPGTDEFSEVYETAVRMYPADENANLNAANAAMRRDDLAAAERYLAKAGDSADAVYARASLAIRAKDYDKAIELLQQAADMGQQQAMETLEELKARIY